VVTFSTTWNIIKAPPRKVAGGMVLPAEFTARWEMEDDHTVEFDVAVERGAPVVNAIRVLRDPSRPSLSGAELRRIPVARWLRLALDDASVRVEAITGGVRVVLSGGDDAEPQAELMPRPHTRRSFTPELAAEVATVWGAAEEYRTAAVRDYFGVSPRTASRWVKQAKKQHPELFDEGDAP
jgi:hypothetical protein